MHERREVSIQAPPCALRHVMSHRSTLIASSRACRNSQCDRCGLGWLNAALLAAAVISADDPVYQADPESANQQWLQYEQNRPARSHQLQRSAAIFHPL